MKIRFRQSGGFAGLLRGCEVETADLPDEDAAKFEGIARKMPSREPSAVARDVERYEIEVEHEAGTSKVGYDASNVPAEVMPLLKMLKSRSGPIPPHP